MKINLKAPFGKKKAAETESVEEEVHVSAEEALRTGDFGKFDDEDEA